MSLKFQIARLLKDSLATKQVSCSKDRILNKQIIKNIFDYSLVPSQTQSPIIRILARDNSNAEEITSILRRNQDTIGLESISIVDKPVDFPSRTLTSADFQSSVLLKVRPKRALLSALIRPEDRKLKENVLGHDQDCEVRPENIVIDFSSPNIAKPFHFGHLKSTILGNFLANLNDFIGHKVTRLNFIGDWGTQYGLLSVGLTEFDYEQREELTLQHLVNIYVKANEKSRADSEFYQRAKERFVELQNNDPKSEIVSSWRRIRERSLSELAAAYEEIGVRFDSIEFESDYAKSSVKLIKEIQEREFISKNEDGAVIAEIERQNQLIHIPLMKSDGASLYISRDMAAATSRFNKYKFDKMLYVVGADQEKHFYCLRSILAKLDHNWHNSLIHVKMGKVIGMSSRSGNFVLLSDIIKESTRRYIEATKNVPTTKVSNPADIEHVGRHLALSALFVADMKNPRTLNYQFDWSLTMTNHSRSGIHLQTTYARLCSLLRKAKSIGIEPIELKDASDISPEPDALCCVEAVNLMGAIEEIETEMHRSYWSRDAYPLVNYAFHLCSAANRARQSERLNVVSEANEKWARTRLSLFESARQHLGLAIQLIGLTPLEKV